MQQQIHFSNISGEKLAGTFHDPVNNSRRGIILGHCFTCSRHTRILRDLSLALVEESFKVLRFDFSGNGQSEGNFSESLYSKQVKDIESAVSFVSSHGVRWIGLAGHSMGAMVALLAASQMDIIKGVCTLAAKASALHSSHFLSQGQIQELKRTGRVNFISRGRNLELTEDFFADAAKYDLSSIMPSLSQPLMVVHGNRDEIIPVENAYQLHQYRKVNTELVIIPGADHMFSQDEDRQEVVHRVARWFRDLASEEGF